MNRIARTLSLIPLILAVSAQAEYLKLPNSVRSHAVYYLNSKQLNKYSCGYNVLFNAANLEHSCGFLNPAHKYQVFDQRVMPYLRDFCIDPKSASSNEMVEYLAKQKLFLQPLFYLYCLENRVKPFISNTVSISYPVGTPQHEIDRRMAQEWRSRRNQEVQKVKQHLQDNPYTVVHFACFVKDQDAGHHAILISLHQNESGRGLFIFDNMNSTIYESSDITSFIQYLIDTYNISTYYSFDPPQLPHRWRHLDDYVG